MAAFKQKLQAVLWLAELKSVEAVRVKWTEQYAEEPPTDQMLLTWKKNFQATENIHSNSDVGTSPLKRPRQDCETTRREDEPEFKFSLQTTLEDIRQKQEDFCTERNWAQYHTPRNVLLALVGEVGELAEIFQWKGEVKEGLPGRSPTKFSYSLKYSRGKAGSASEGMGLIGLWYYCGNVIAVCVSLHHYFWPKMDRRLQTVLLTWLIYTHLYHQSTNAVLSKFLKNSKKYPADKVFGKSNKYTDYRDQLKET
ncbi:uncharacterized protein LOC106878263 [Octopus bimaculoides]|uniref:uncharacterized protein LOC106878263 n=1 Tax=Octopus bimaculoides TaxID=37653 RepID=UPI0022E6BEFD|nr:uncharacterized protein LOC106878263 [Octopus bimaculoides]